MTGPEGLAAALAALLEANVVAEVTNTILELGPLADGTGLPANPGDPTDDAAILALVTPQLIAPAPPDDVTNVQVDQWPFLAVSVQRAPQLRRLDMDPWSGPPGLGGSQVAGIVYEVTYQARLNTWVRGDGYEQTRAVRDRLALAVRQTVLRHQLVAGGIRLVEQTVLEEYSPVGLDTTLEATVGVAYLQAQWRAQETLLTDTDGPASSVTVTVGRLDTP
jgi:hypothetical protein